MVCPFSIINQVSLATDHLRAKCSVVVSLNMALSTLGTLQYIEVVCSGSNFIYSQYLT